MISFLLYLLLTTGCGCFFVEINLHGKNESRSLKLLCGPPSENMNFKSNHKLLWHGSEFGSDERQRLAGTIDADSLVPNLSIKSSNRHLCYLMASDNFENNQRRRVSRNSVASIPMENGICPPGHRIDQNRCFPCFPGSFTSGQQSKCFLCPKDFYMDKMAADSCWPCPEGKKTLSQGADTEDACVYFDESGHPAIKQEPPWVVIYTMIGVIILCVWIIIFVLLVRHWRELTKQDEDDHEEEGGEGRKYGGFRKYLLRRKTTGKGGGIQDTKSDSSQSPGDHIYTEISDSEDIYEEPLQPDDRDMYLDLEAPELPPKRSMKTVAVEGRKSVDRDGYEVPIKKSSDRYKVPIKKSSEGYEVPIKKSSNGGFYTTSAPSDDHSYEEIPLKYEVPIKKSSDGYEVPIKKSSEGYEVPIKKSSDGYEVPIKKSSDGYEVPIKKSSNGGFYTTSAPSDHHSYEEIPMKNDGYEVPIQKSSDGGFYMTSAESDDHNYEEIPIKNDGYEVPIQKSSDGGFYMTSAESDDHNYEEIPIKNDEYEVPIKKSLDGGFYMTSAPSDDRSYEEIPIKNDDYEFPIKAVSDAQADLYDDVQYASDERQMTSEETRSGRPPKTYSSSIRALVGNLPSSSAEGSRSNRASTRKPSQSYSGRKYSKMHGKSDERAAGIPEEIESTYYDIPEYGSMQ